jgi:hypothetical protein
MNWNGIKLQKNLFFDSDTGILLFPIVEVLMDEPYYQLAFLEKGQKEHKKFVKGSENKKSFFELIRTLTVRKMTS